MSDRFPTGKLPADLLRELLAAGPSLPPEVLVGPSIGEDACAIAVPAGTLVAATDPITLTGSGVGAHAVTINANDVAVMGVRPRWFLAAVLLPLETAEADVRALFAEMRAALDTIGAVLVGGHTEITNAVVQPVVVGQMLGLSESGRVLRTGGARPGDVIVQAGPAPVEAAAVLAIERRQALATLDADLMERAARAIEIPGMSVVESALCAAELGATALHDPTEGGLAVGLQEIAEASGVALRVDEGAVLWFEPGRAVCRALGADPWGALASGSLLAAFPAGSAEAACRELTRRGCEARVIAGVEAGHGVAHRDGRALPSFPRDEVARLLSED